MNNKNVMKNLKHVKINNEVKDTKYNFIINNNNVEIDLSKNTIIYGLNGCGKTRLLNTLYGINNNKYSLVNLEEAGIQSPEKEKNMLLIRENSELFNEFFEILLTENYSYTIRREAKELLSYVNDINREYDPFNLKFRTLRLGSRLLKFKEIEDNNSENYINSSEYIKLLLAQIKNIPMERVSFEKKAEVYYIQTTRSKDNIDNILKEYINSALVVDGINENVQFYNEVKIIEEKCKILNKILKQYLNIKVSIDIINKEFILDDRSSFDALSSGEKNIIVLFATVVFMSDDSVLLIDEPEISFSINYQNRFIQDVLSINEKVKFIIATHSPFIYRDAAEENFTKIELRK